MDNNVIAYTDGSCLGNPGPGGWAAIVYEKGASREIHGGHFKTTNNRMELRAVVEAVRAIETAGSSILIISDSKYVTEPLRRYRETGGFFVKTNLDLWLALDEALREGGHSIGSQWVRGHNGNYQNTLCDRWAKKEAQDIRKQQPVRLIVFQELLMDPDQLPEVIATRHAIPLWMAEKYTIMFKEG